MGEQPHPPLQGEYQTMHSPLSGIIRRTPVTVAPQFSVRVALQIMEQHRIGSIVIAEPETLIPLGIFTLQDLLRRISLRNGDLEQPIANVMTRDLVTLDPHTTAYQAALTMARHGLRHILIVDEQGRLLGIVSQNDLFSLQRTGIKEISNEIGGARDMDVLIHAARDIRQLADSMLAQGIGAEQLTHFISTLNDLLTLRIIELTQAEFELPPVKWCWIALGSEGRFEQTFTTDQDNAIMFESADSDADRARQQFLPFAQAVNRKLDACGFLLCKGDIMAGNPMWCLSLNEWQRKFSGWIQTPRPKALLFASIFFDFRPLYGEHELTVTLRNWLLDACGKNSLFLQQMAANALQSQPPLGVFRDFRVQKTGQFPHTIDLKMAGLWPFINAARIFALAYGIPETNTARRLRSVAGKMNFSNEEIAAIVDSFYYIQRLRLRHQHKLQGLAEGANRINPDALNPLDRRILKEAFKQARRLQSRLQLDYQL
ncbi:MAG: nucleotidyltransferase [Burkholderiales bacterium RIFCSPLOWO2_02_FULL_57_36]|nr:MAG: nucleotidyltransferase [Burkholderiales bacterium RIFCSPLOWO2_02_FULL_57_36]